MIFKSLLCPVAAERILVTAVTMILTEYVELALVAGAISTYVFENMNNNDSLTRELFYKSSMNIV